MFSGMKRSEPLFPEYLQQQQQQQGYGDQGGQGSYNQDVRMDGYGGGGHQQQQQNGGQRRNSPQLARLKIGQNISLRPGSELGRGRPQGPAGMQQQQQQQQQQSNQPGRISTVNSKLPTDKKGKKLSKAQLEKQVRLVLLWLCCDCAGTPQPVPKLYSFGGGYTRVDAVMTLPAPPHRTGAGTLTCPVCACCIRSAVDSVCLPPPRPRISRHRSWKSTCRSGTPLRPSSASTR